MENLAEFLAEVGRGRQREREKSNKKKRRRKKQKEKKRHPEGVKSPPSDDIMREREESIIYR